MSREPLPRTRHAAVGVGKKLYVWAGYWANQATTIETFDVSSEVWEHPRQLRGTLPHGLGHMAVATDGKSAYQFGGACVSRRYSSLSSLYQIDLSTLQCRELVPRRSFPVPKRGSRMVYFNQKLVVHGGFVNRNVVDELKVFDLKMSE